MKKNTSLKYGSKKGNMAIELILIISVLIVVGAVVLAMGKLQNIFNDELQLSDDYYDLPKEVMQDQADGFPTVWDNIFITILILLWIGTILSAFLIDTHPVFFILGILLLIVVLVIAVYATNAFEDFANSFDEDYYALFPKMAFIIGHLMEICIVMGVTISVALYARFKVM